MNPTMLGHHMIVEFSVIGFNPMQVLSGGLGAVVLGLAARRWLGQTRPRERALR